MPNQPIKEVNEEHSSEDELCAIPDGESDSEEDLYDSNPSDDDTVSNDSFHDSKKPPKLSISDSASVPSSF